MAMRYYNTEGPGGVAALSPPGSNYINNYSLSAGIAQTVVWPSDAGFMSISAAPPYWVRFGGTNTFTPVAVVPAGNTTDGTGSALNPAQRRRGTGEVSFSIISAAAQEISVEFWGTAAGS